MEIVSVIPARGGSKGIKKKNLIDLKGQPLLSYSVNASLSSKVNKTYVCTEDDEIILEEQEVSKPTSDYTSINALVEAFNTKK